MKPILSRELLDFSRRDFVIVVADTLEKAVKHFCKHYKSKQVKVADCKGSTALCVVEKNGACALLFARPALCASTICHEITHATNAMLLHIGMELDNGSDEAFAYHNEMLFRKVGEFLDMHNIAIPLMPAK